MQLKYGGIKSMLKKSVMIFMSVIIFWMSLSSGGLEDVSSRNGIKRLTYSGNNVARYPCLSDDGRWMLYVLEIKDDEETVKSIRIMNVEDGQERELFRDGEKKASELFEEAPLIVGTKPPVLSGDGRVAAFALSLGAPWGVLDHYLAVVNSDGTDFRIFDFSIEALKGTETESLGFRSDQWERVSAYASSQDGKRMACVLKGYLGPRRYGQASGIVLLDVSLEKQKTLLAPDFIENEWRWTSQPQRPLTGGGWALAISGDGERVVFGAQSSQDDTDYDLYVSDWQGTGIAKITDFKDRWFSQADMSLDGEKVIFYYNGKQKQGMGTYVVNIDGSGLKHLESRVSPRVEFFDMSGNGRYILFKHIYSGMVLDLVTGQEAVAFDDKTPGYATGLIPMDFPGFPSFWSPRIMDFDGQRVLLVGSPSGKETPEIFLLRLDLK